MSEINISIKSVNDNDIEFLYEMLKERESYQNISHQKMPTFKKHTSFVKSKPYSKWYIVYLEKNKIGSIYLSKNNEIGIFLKKAYNKKGFGSLALKLLFNKNPRKKYYANINPKNSKSIKFFKENGFNLLQQTYVITKKS